MRETTNPTVATIVSLRMAGVATVVMMAAVPVAAIFFALSANSLAGLLIAPVAWAVLGAVIYFLLKRTGDARTLVLLVTLCCAGWTLAVGGPPAYSLRNSHSAILLLVLLVLTASLTGATFGFVCFLRYRGLPPHLRGAARLAGLAALPALILLVVFNVMLALNTGGLGHRATAAGTVKEAVLVLVAPIILAMLVSWISIELTRRGVTKPSGIS